MEKEVTIWYDQDGRILAWGHLNPEAPVTLSAIPLTESGHGALTVKISEHHLGDLHEQHYVDTDAKKLVKKSSE